MPRKPGAHPGTGLTRRSPALDIRAFHHEGDVAFLIQGGLLGFCGSLVGGGLGTLLAVAFARISRASDGSPMFTVPLPALLFVGATLLATAVGVLAAVAPARRAARLDPAEAIRHG